MHIIYYLKLVAPCPQNYSQFQLLFYTHRTSVCIGECLFIYTIWYIKRKLLYIHITPSPRWKPQKAGSIKYKILPGTYKNRCICYQLHPHSFDFFFFFKYFFILSGRSAHCNVVWPTVAIHLKNAFLIFPFWYECTTRRS